jgi:hydroxyethylthiazole kinase
MGCPVESCRAERLLANPSNLIRVMPAEGAEMRTPDAELPMIAADVLDRLRVLRPRVHCITNAVAQAFTANVLLATGAVPSMTISADEVGDFVAGADALLVNLGTFDAERRNATDIAVKSAVAHRKSWVLDPVFIDRTPKRAAYARSLLASGPHAIRCNSAEFAALAGDAPQSGNLMQFAREQVAAVGLTGAIDHVTDGARSAAIANGSPLMAKITAMGCAGSSLVAAALAVESDPWRATAAALIWLGVAGDIAAQTATGPGSLAVGILDCLHRLDADALITHARVS